MILLLIKKREGFSIVELMIVVAIIGILAGVAVPFYVNYVRRARMKDGVNKLLELQGAMEQFRSINRRYPADLAELSTNFTIGLDASDQDQYYQYSIDAVSTSDFTIDAEALKDDNVMEMGRRMTISRSGDPLYSQ